VDPWIATALSATLIAFGVELTCYYYAFIIVVAVLFYKHESAGRWLLGVTAFTQFIGWAPIQGMPDWLGKILPASWRNAPAFKNFGMPTGLDEQYTWMALATLFGFVMIAWDMMVARQAALAPAAAKPEIPAKPAEAPPPAEAEEEDDEAKEEPAQPVWRERLERRMHGGKRRRHR
jgi:hypothetical protein